MSVPAAVLILLFAPTIFSSGKRIQQHKTVNLIEVQAARGSPPLLPRTSDSSGGGGSGLPADSSGRGSSGRRQSYGLAGIGRAMASGDEAALAAVAEDALDKQKVFGSVDRNNDRELNLQELEDGMEELGSEMPDVELQQRFGHRDAEIDADQLAATVEAKAAMSSERVREHPPETLKRNIFRQVFEQEVVRVIDSLINRDIQEYKTRLPKWAAFLPLLHATVFPAASDVFIDLDKNCGAHEHIQSGFQCILDKLQPLIGQEGEQTLDVGKTSLQISIEMMFAQLESRVKGHLKTLKDEV